MIFNLIFNFLIKIYDWNKEKCLIILKVNFSKFLAKQSKSKRYMLMFNLSKELMDFFVIFTSKVKFLKLRKCEEERGEEQIND